MALGSWWIFQMFLDSSKARCFWYWLGVEPWAPSVEPWTPTTNSGKWRFRLGFTGSLFLRQIKAGTAKEQALGDCNEGRIHHVEKIIMVRRILFMNMIC